MSDPITTPALRPREVKPTVTLKRSTALIAAGAIILVGLFIGTLIGFGGGSGDDSAAQPAPTVTVTSEPVIVEGPPPASIVSCQEAATELYSILQVTVDQALIPYNQATMNLIEMLQYSDYSKVEETTGIIDGVTGVVEEQTARVQAITPTYEACINP